MGFAEVFASLRREAGLSQRRVAEELGISQALLSHYENGLREPRLDFIGKICDYYGVAADYLLGRSALRGGAGTETEASRGAALCFGLELLCLENRFADEAGRHVCRAALALQEAVWARTPGAGPEAAREGLRLASADPDAAGERAGARLRELETEAMP